MRAARAASPFRLPAWTALVLAALFAGPVLVFEGLFGSLAGVAAAGGGVAVGLALALVATRFRWDALTTGVVAAASYLALGGVAAARETALGGVLPTLRTVQVLLFGVVTAWRDVLTLNPPAAAYGGAAAALPWLVGLVAGLASGLLSIRDGRPVLGTVPLGAMAVVAVAWGLAGDQPPAWPAAGWAAAVVAWWAWARQRARTGPARAIVVASGRGAARAGLRRGVAAALTLALAGGVASGAVSLRGPADRTVLRDLVEPPLELHDIASPLASLRHYNTELAGTTLVRAAGLPAGARVRLGVMDTYNGVTFGISDPSVGAAGRYVRSGARVRPPVGGEGAPATVELSASDLVGPWLPSVGAVDGVTFSGPDAAAQQAGLHVNLWADALLTTAAGRGWSATYEVSTVVEPQWSDGQLAGVRTEAFSSTPDSGVPERVIELAREVGVSEASPLGRARAIERHLSKTGFYLNEDTPQSRPGHRADRLARMLELEELIGDDEQYATLMTLMLHAQGIPARVVMGLYPDAPPAQGEPVVLRGRDVHAWVEVPFQGVGWAVFDPTPPRNQVPQTKAPKPRSVPRSQVLQPPAPPEPPVELPPAVTDRDRPDEPNDTFRVPWLVIGGVAGGLAVVFGPMLLVLGLKAARTRRRRTAADPSAAVRGAWDEAVDLALDAGVRLPRNLTRQEAAHVLAGGNPAGAHWYVAGATLPPSVSLARRADTADFAPEPTPAATVGAAWTDVADVRSGLAAGVGRWVRARRRLSLRSLLKRRPRTSAVVRVTRAAKRLVGRRSR